MCSWILQQHPSLLNVVLGITFIAISHDLVLSRMGVQAWTYNYTTKTPLDWESSRRYCREHFTDMVAIQNKAEITYLNQVLPRNPSYYWIGIRKVKETWTWVGTKKALTPEAENWATGEPNDLGDGQDCVEIYIKREKDTGKWNDENCKKRKGVICYTASCSEGSCSKYGECEETIGAFRCRCEPGFEGARCERAVACGPVHAPDGSMTCRNPFGENRYNSSCQIHCKPGWKPLRAAQTRCLATGQWDQQTPFCQVITCKPLLVPSGVDFTCENPLGDSSCYSTCDFSCKEGHTLRGPPRLTCLPLGVWTGEAPVCEVVHCRPLHFPFNGKLRCQDPLEEFSYNSTCWSECDSGFDVKGNNSTHCSAQGVWSHNLTGCQVAVKCDKLKAPPNGKLQCQDPFEKFSYNSTCLPECDSGFTIKGSTSTRCSLQGKWTKPLPVCQAVECPEVSVAPSGGTVNCSHPIALHSFTSTCEFRCNEGLLLQGAQRIECDHTGQWTHRAPTCKVIQCDQLKAPLHGKLRCQDPLEKFSYSSTCWSECDTGFTLKGSNSTHCSAQGQWSHTLPVCQVVACEQLNAPSQGKLQCQDPLEKFCYNSTCWSECDTGFTLKGSNSTHCSAQGQWSNTLPVCQVAVKCDKLKAPPNGKLQCQDPFEKFSYNSTCWSECDSGFTIKGSTSTRCSLQGQWTKPLPVCQAVECPEVSVAPSGGTVNCSHPIALHSFTSTCEFRCNEGLLLQGAQRIECDHTGQWTHRAPTCKVIQCDQLKAPLHGKLKCQDPLEKFSYSSTCLSECDTGFTLKGSNSTHCSAQGQWSHTLPVCQVVACEQLNAPSHGKLQCQDPLEKFSYSSTCWSECDTGFTLKGSNSTQCSAQGQWSHTLPVCQAVECPEVSDAPSGGTVNCSHPIALHSFTSTCEFRCNEGLLLQGAQRIECDHTGQWTHRAPTCKVIQCDQLKAPLHGKLKCQDPLEKFSYSSTCLSECDTGFTLKGSNSTHCSAQGQWSHTLPVCQVVACEQLNAPSHGKLQCQDPLEKFSYSSTCWSECVSGFILKGSNSTQCSAQGQWSHTLPACQAVECPRVTSPPSGGTVNCSHPIALHRFTSTCEFRCDEGFLLQGARRTKCDHTGQWTPRAPTCTVREMSLGAALLMYTAIGTASAVGLIGLIGVIYLVRRATKKASNSDGDTLWNSGINPVFEE
ncbi:P-selectin-like [Clupea harengus]|uniref:E-selectin n=1 Tax=Clupea harengus TaxID=7950 RepID=A0A8M1KQL8_CLUHA|nr:P-selectin-like [Clupea harengus]